MAIFKCKMCGGTLEVSENAKVCECEYCGTKQTIPSVKEENLQSLFNRANVLRMKAEFDKAADIYERIIQADETEAEAYWGLVLCKYGVEYVEDPATYKRVPTCHRTSYDAVVSDADYHKALENADTMQKAIYEAEAKAIDDIQKGILALASSESPYDVFICYKETDENNKRTVDSVIANDIYHQLTREGFKVFYSAITLEDKLGSEYEPYIFSALNSAKVMLVVGTKPEYFEAVWVKNEWSRFMKFMRMDRSRTLIPCYRDMDAYELPEEFAHLQAQDMSRIGFINDIVRGINKIIPRTVNERGQTYEEGMIRSMEIFESQFPGYKNKLLAGKILSAMIGKGKMTTLDLFKILESQNASKSLDVNMPKLAYFMHTLVKLGMVNKTVERLNAYYEIVYSKETEYILDGMK